MKAPCAYCGKSESALVCDGCGARFCAECIEPREIVLLPPTATMRAITAHRKLCPWCAGPKTEAETP